MTAMASPTSGNPDAQSHRDTHLIPSNVKVILAVLVITTFVMMLNETTLGVALPSIMADYQISAETGQWLITGHLLTMAVVLPTTGWLLERFMTRTVFLVAMSAFLLGTVTAALSPNFALLLVSRIAQGAGTAMILPLLMTVTMNLVPVRRRGTVMGLIAVVMAGGPALGPTFAGSVLGFASWHWIFWLMTPLVAIASVIGILKLTNAGETREAAFDLLSVILSAFAFGGLVYGLSSIGVIIEGGASATLPLVVFGVSIISFALFVWHQLRLSKQAAALLDLRPLRVANFTLSALAIMGLMAALLGVLNTLPLYVQGSLLASAFIAGFVLLPGGLLETALSPLAGLLYDRVGPRLLIIPGMAIATGTLLWLSTADESSSVWLIITINIILSIGLALLFGPLMSTAMGSLPSDLYSHGSAIYNTLMQLAGAAGTALMITIFGRVSARAQEAGTPPTVALAEGASASFLTSASICAVALVLTLFITRPAAASQPSPAHK